MRPHDQEDAALFAFLRANNNEHKLVLEVQGSEKNLFTDPYTRSILFGRLNTHQQSLPAASVSGLQLLITPKVNRVIPTYNTTKEEFRHWHLVLMRPWESPGIPGHHKDIREVQDDLRALKVFLQRLYGLPAAAMWTTLFEEFLVLFDDTDVETSIRGLPFPKLLLVTYEWIETLFNSFIKPDFRSLSQDAFITKVKASLVVNVEAHRRSAGAAFQAMLQSKPMPLQGFSAAAIQMATSAGLNLAPASAIGSGGGALAIPPNRRSKTKAATAAASLLAPGRKGRTKSSPSALLAAATAAATVPTAAPGARVVIASAGKIQCMSNLSFRLALQSADCRLGSACLRTHLGVLPTPIGSQRAALQADVQLCTVNVAFKAQLLAAIAALA